jgi:hypothetical protein
MSFGINCLARSNPVAKKQWRKPEVKAIAAGSAEINAGGADDGDKDAAKNNS